MVLGIFGSGAIAVSSIQKNHNLKVCCTWKWKSFELMADKAQRKIYHIGRFHHVMNARTVNNLHDALCATQCLFLLYLAPFVSYNVSLRNAKSWPLGASFNFLAYRYIGSVISSCGNERVYCGQRVIKKLIRNRCKYLHDYCILQDEMIA